LLDEVGDGARRTADVSGWSAGGICGRSSGRSAVATATAARCRSRLWGGGPDRIRTGDLQRDRLACWAATPRVRAADAESSRKSGYPRRPMPELTDLRSDTVTQPSPAMRQAMADARLGDDVFEGDPTVQGLAAAAADLLGKEAGLFVASGTMGNLVSLVAHVPRGGEIIADARSHTVIDEQAGHAVVVGASVRQLRSASDGTMDPADVREAFRVDD